MCDTKVKVGWFPRQPCETNNLSQIFWSILNCINLEKSVAQVKQVWIRSRGQQPYELLSSGQKQDIL